MKVTVIDYGRSNLLSVQRALEYCGAQVEFARSPDDIGQACALVLPGVGAFADGMAMLEQNGLVEAIVAQARQDVPLLGICLGMQMLFEQSSEGGLSKGLGLLSGTVEHLPVQGLDGEPLKCPQVGWNALHLEPGAKGSILRDVPTAGQAYFVHSYHVVPENESDCVANVLYGGRRVCAAVQRRNVMGVQFHPEKSGEVGLSILRAFLHDCGQ